MYTTCPLSPTYELTVHPTHLGLQDEMKINNLQIQFQSEKQERKIEGLERRFELKLDELAKNIQLIKTNCQHSKKIFRRCKCNLLLAKIKFFKPGARLVS